MSENSSNDEKDTAHYVITDPGPPGSAGSNNTGQQFVGSGDTQQEAEEEAEKAGYDVSDPAESEQSGKETEQPEKKVAEVRDPDTGKAVKVTSPTVKAGAENQQKRSGVEDPVFTPGEDEKIDTPENLSQKEKEKLKQIDRAFDDAGRGEVTNITSTDSGRTKVQYQASKSRKQRSRRDKDMVLKSGGRTGKATEFGREFYSETQRLKNLPTTAIPALQEAAEDVRRGKFNEASKVFTDPPQTLGGEFIEDSIVGQFKAAGARLDAYPGTKGNPRQAFQEQLPEMSVAQNRFSRFIDKKVEKNTTPAQREALAEAASKGLLKSTPQGQLIISADKAVQGQPVQEGTEKLLTSTAAGGPEEVIEKTAEIPALTGAAAQAVSEPGKTAGQIAQGSRELAGKVSDNPIGFTGKELVADVGLDLATGGGAAVAIPTAQKVSTTAGKVREQAENVLKEYKRLRQGAKEGPNALDAAAETAAKNLEIQKVASATDTISPTDTQGPGQTPGPDLLETEETTSTKEFELETDTQTAADTDSLLQQKSAALSLTGASAFSEPEAIAASRPESDALSEAVPRTQSQAVSEPVVQSAAISTTQTVAEPQVVPEPNPQPQPQPQEDSSEDDDSSSLFSGPLFSSKDTEYRGSVGSEVLGIEAEKKPGRAEAQNPLNLRPVVGQNNSDSSDDDSIF